ncbi:MAG: hypothetical protein C0483_03275 [Pirellula sp.]|nr:hypothetical protein [Pirellula sp.]
MRSVPSGFGRNGRAVGVDRTTRAPPGTLLSGGRNGGGNARKTMDGDALLDSPRPHGHNSYNRYARRSEPMVMLFAFAAHEASPYAYADIVKAAAGFIIVVAVGFYLVGKFRGAYRQTDGVDTNLLSNFRELHSRGELSDEEYRTIKAQLATKIREQFAESDKTSVADKVDFTDA